MVFFAWDRNQRMIPGVPNFSLKDLRSGRLRDKGLVLMGRGRKNRPYYGAISIETL